MTEGDRYFSYGTMIDRSLRIFVDYVNKEKGGIVVGSRRYGVRLVVVEDGSSAEQVTNATANALRPPAGPADFAWGPYSSGLNQYAVRQSYADGKLTVNSGSSKSSVYALNNLTFGVLPSSTTYLNPVFATLQQAAAASGVPLSSFKMGCIGDNSGHMAQCAQVPGLARAMGIDVNETEYAALSTRVGNPPTQLEVNETLARYRAAGVTILISTGYNATQWVVVQGMMALDYTPLAAVCTISYIPSWAGEYLFHPSPWAASRPVRGAWSGLTSSEFASRFASRYGADAPLTYQGAGAFGGASALAAAIEAAGTLETQAVARQMYGLQFDEFYGNFSFSAAGQAQFPFLMLQHTHAQQVNEIVYPAAEVVGGTTVEFPMPTWAQRFCRAMGPGNTFATYVPTAGAAAATVECSGHGACNSAGACECAGGYSGGSCEVAPAASDQYTISSSMNLAGDIADFSDLVQFELKVSVAAQLNARASEVAIRIEPGSVALILDVSLSSEAAATAAIDTLRFNLANPATASVFLTTASYTPVVQTIIMEPQIIRVPSSEPTSNSVDGMRIALILVSTLLGVAVIVVASQAARLRKASGEAKTLVCSDIARDCLLHAPAPWPNLSLPSLVPHTSYAHGPCSCLTILLNAQLSLCKHSIDLMAFGCSAQHLMPGASTPKLLLKTEVEQSRQI